MLVVLQLILAVGLAELMPSAENPLLGSWQFHRYIYQGQEQPIPNPNLILQYEFRADGLNRLFWSRKNEFGFCDRLASYHYEDQTLQQEVLWVNPENSMECSKDVDMQVGTVNWAKMVFVEGRLHLYVPFGGEDFIYVFRRIRTP